MTTILDNVVEECTTFVEQNASWINGHLSSGGNAGDWLSHLSGLQTSNTPQSGDIVVYAANGNNGMYSSSGHVAIVDQVLSPGQFTVSESNFRSSSNPYGYAQSGRLSSMAGVLGFITPNAGTPGGTISAPTTAGWAPTVTGGTYHVSLGSAFTGGSGVTGFISGIEQYFSQSSTWRTFMIGGVAVGLIIIGLKFLGAPDPVRPVVNLVSRDTATVAKDAT